MEMCNFCNIDYCKILKKKMNNLKPKNLIIHFIVCKLRDRMFHRRHCAFKVSIPYNNIHHVFYDHTRHHNFTVP